MANRRVWWFLAWRVLLVHAFELQIAEAGEADGTKRATDDVALPSGGRGNHDTPDGHRQECHRAPEEEHHDKAGNVRDDNTEICGKLHGNSPSC